MKSPLPLRRSTLRRLVTALPLAMAMMAALAALSCGKGRALDDDDDDNASPEDMVDYLRAREAFPFRQVPDGARLAAWNARIARWPALAARVSPLAAGVNTTTTWTTLGPQPITSGSLIAAGRVTAIALDPTDSTIIYIGAATGGVWKSTNSGTTWSPLTDTQCSLGIGALAVDPVNPKILYAGTGEPNYSGDSFFGCGLLRSVDGGQSWTTLGSSVFNFATGGTSMFRVWIDPSTAGSTTTTTLLVAAISGLWRSTDGGGSWTRVMTGTASDLVAAPGQPGVLYAGVGTPIQTQTNSGVYKSVDRGATWTRLAGGLPAAAAIGRLALAVAPSATQTVYAYMSGPTTFYLGLFRSIDGGTTWTQQAATVPSSFTNLCDAQCWYDMDIAVDPLDANTIYVGGVNFFKSADGGATFSVSAAPHTDHHAALFDSRSHTLYEGCDGGLFKTADAGATWQSLNAGLSITQFYAIAVNPVTPGQLAGGTQDNGTNETTGGTSWQSILGGDGGFVAYDQLGTTTYGETQWSSKGGNIGPLRRDPGNKNFTIAGNGINGNDQALFIPPFTIDPVDSRVLYFGTQLLYRTANRGVSWTAISSKLSNTGSISAITVAPSDPKTVYVGGSDGTLWVTRNLGASWTAINTGLPSRYYTTIVVDPRDPLTAYVSAGGFQSGHVFRTVNAGASWTDLTGNLPDNPAQSLFLQPGSRELDVGMDFGVYALAYGSSTWTPLGLGLPNVPVYQLGFDRGANRLYAATHGRGIFSIDLTLTALRGDITNDGQLTAADAQAILSATLGLALPTGAQRFPNGDANCDGEVTSVDALLVLSKLVGLNVGSACVGQSK